MVQYHKICIACKKPFITKYYEENKCGKCLTLQVLKREEWFSFWSKGNRKKW